VLLFYQYHFNFRAYIVISNHYHCNADRSTYMNILIYHYWWKNKYEKSE